MSAVHVIAVVIIAAVFLLYLGVVRMKVVDWIGAKYKAALAGTSDRAAGIAFLVEVLAFAIAIAF